MPRISTARDDDTGPVSALDTADRLRPAGVHEPMHDARGSESDARNTPRETLADYQYRPPTHLDAPPPRPGYVQRWVRSEFRTENDNLNWQAKLREGWAPRDPKTVPGHLYFFGQTSKTGQDVIRVGGMILMECPEAKVRLKREAIREAVRRQEQSVSMDTDKASREGRAVGAHPIIREETTEVSRGHRRPPTLAD